MRLLAPARFLRLQQDYELAREAFGDTVEEFELRRGLPPFSIYPGARIARVRSAPGWFMYSEETREAALAEEDRQMAVIRALGVHFREIALIYATTPCRVLRRLRTRLGSTSTRLDVAAS